MLQYDVMEFLPPDIAPLHDPQQSDCDPIVCLDPRRSAEDVCTSALNASAPKDPLNVLAHQIELALNDPASFEFPDIQNRAAKLYNPQMPDTNYVRARTLLATSALFEYRAARSIVPEHAFHEAYMALAGLAASFTPRRVKSQSFRGHLAEIAVHGLLLRGMHNVPFLTSAREERSPNKKLNNDLAALSNRTGYTEKVPIQVKFKNDGSHPNYIAHRVLPVFAKPFFTEHIPLSSVYTQSDTIVRDVFSLIVQEADGKFSTKSASAKVLQAISRALNFQIDDYRESFKDSALGDGVRRLVDKHVANRSRGAAEAHLGMSEYVELEDGGCAVFNNLVVRRKRQTDSTERYITFRHDQDVLGSICYRTALGVTPSMQQASSRRFPDDLPQQMLMRLAQPDVQARWQQV